jgi:hypothetical protein
MFSVKDNEPALMAVTAVKLVTTHLLYNSNPALIVVLAMRPVTTRLLHNSEPALTVVKLLTIVGRLLVCIDGGANTFAGAVRGSIAYFHSDVEI